MATFSAQPLSGAAIDVRCQLFRCGPQWDGDLSSKRGRDELVEIGHAARYDGWNWLTDLGVEAAIDDGLGVDKERWERQRRQARA